MANEFQLMPDDARSDLQALNESNFPHVVVRATIAPSSGVRVGGALVDSAPIVLLEGAPCRLNASRPVATSDATQRRTAAGWLLTMARGTVLPPNAIVLVRGQDRDVDAQWERSVRVLDSMSARGITSIARFACVDAGPTEPRTN